MRRMYTTEGIQKIIDESIDDAFENDAEFGGNLDVAGNLKVPSFENILDENNNKLSDQYLLENIKDQSGHNRFIEGIGTDLSGTGVTITYIKWSLSGTHLMLVLGGSITNGSEAGDNNIKASFSLPEWVMNKLYPIIGSYLEIKNVKAFASDGSSQDIPFIFYKQGNDNIVFESYGSVTMSSDKGFRVQLDLLIDNQS